MPVGSGGSQRRQVALEQVLIAAVERLGGRTGTIEAGRDDCLSTGSATVNFMIPQPHFPNVFTRHVPAILTQLLNARIKPRRADLHE